MNIKNKFKNGIMWLRFRPVAVVNIVFIIAILTIFINLMVRPIDVLTDWKVYTSKQQINGVKPTYYPGGTLEFVTTAKKLVSADGTSTRVMDCDATATTPAREIVLPSVVANRAPGNLNARESSIVVPSVSEFNGLPRTCRIKFYVCYQNVVLWRDWCESNQTNDFTVAEDVMNPEAIRQQIQELNQKIETLEQRLGVSENNLNVANNSAISGQSDTAQSQTTNNTTNTTNNSTTNITQEQASDNRNVFERVRDAVTGLF